MQFFFSLSPFLVLSLQRLDVSVEQKSQSLSCRISEREAGKQIQRARSEGEKDRKKGGIFSSSSFSCVEERRSEHMHTSVRCLCGCAAASAIIAAVILTVIASLLLAAPDIIKNRLPREEMITFKPTGWTPPTLPRGEIAVRTGECRCTTAGLSPYGRWCGFGYTGIAGVDEPCDALDACCMAHDLCVGSEGLMSCGCHAALVECAICVYVSPEARGDWCVHAGDAAAMIVADITYIFPYCIIPDIITNTTTTIAVK